jgi:DNA-binding MarR family transcriptional regulator
MAQENGKGKDPRKALDEEAVELATLLAEVVHAGKRRSGRPPREMEEAAEREGLGPRHAPVLFAVALEGGLSVSELAERVGLSLATTSLLVGELSRAGILTRTEDERDRRRTIVTIAEGREELIGGWVRQIVHPMRSALDRMSPRGRADFMRGLRILAEEVTRHSAEVEDGARVRG